MASKGTVKELGSSRFLNKFMHLFAAAIIALSKNNNSVDRSVNVLEAASIAALINSVQGKCQGLSPTYIIFLLIYFSQFLSALKPFHDFLFLKFLKFLKCS